MGAKMLCKECGGDGWKTVASSNGAVTIVCIVCDGTGVAHLIPEHTAPIKPHNPAFWDYAQAAINGDTNATDRNWRNLL